MRKLIIASHGELAKGILHSASMIVGDLAKDIETYCLYPGENPNDFVQKLLNTFDTQLEYIILCDLKGGSVHTAFSRLGIHPNFKIFSGLNLNLLLDILVSYPNTMDEDMQKQVLKNAKDGITLTMHCKQGCTEDDDF